MASQLKVDTLTGVTTAGSIAVTGEGNSTTTNLQQGLCKSWINFDMVSSFSARDSFNHSSETDNGTGDITLTVTNSFSNINYSHAMMGGHSSTSLIAVMQPINLAAPTTSTARYQIAYVNATLYDADLNCIWNAGDLA
jgi:DUF4097 and DUF4098 domain-containing protein YvlB